LKKKRNQEKKHSIVLVVFVDGRRASGRDF
jgi:hypothetical protein